MNSKNEICLVAWYDSVNFGTCLQAYALSKTIKDLGYLPYILNTHKYFYGINHPIYTLTNILSKLHRTKKDEKAFDVRKEKNHCFAQKYNNVYVVHDKKEYNRKINSTQIFVTGSDQIWNPYIVTPPFLLAMTQDRNNIKRIAYGSSIGTGNIPFNKRNMFKKYLMLFDSIGVREYSAAIEINNLLKSTVTIKQVLDPTFLIDPPIYIDLAGKSKGFEYLNNKKYVLCYFVGNVKLDFADIGRFASECGCEVINIVVESKGMNDCTMNLYDVGVEDFLWLLLNAKYVISDSFHASVFSILFQKQFLIIKRFKDDDTRSQNSRIVDLFSKLHISSRFVEASTSFEILLQDIDYSYIQKTLKKMIEDSRKFLTEGLECV